MPRAGGCLACSIPFYSVFTLLLWIGISNAVKGLAWLTLLYYAGLLASLGTGYLCCKHSNSATLPGFATVLWAVWPSLLIPLIPVTAALLHPEHHVLNPVLRHVSKPNPFLYDALLVYANGKLLYSMCPTCTGWEPLQEQRTM